MNHFYIKRDKFVWRVCFDHDWCWNAVQGDPAGESLPASPGISLSGVPGSSRVWIKPSRLSPTGLTNICYNFAVLYFSNRRLWTLEIIFMVVIKSRLLLYLFQVATCVSRIGVQRKPKPCSWALVWMEWMKSCIKELSAGGGCCAACPSTAAPLGTLLHTLAAAQDQGIHLRGHWELTLHIK